MSPVSNQPQSEVHLLTRVDSPMKTFSVTSRVALSYLVVMNAPRNVGRSADASVIYIVQEDRVRLAKARRNFGSNPLMTSLVIYRPRVDKLVRRHHLANQTHP